ncbi:MAG: reverse transcriptase family protein, partial [Bacteroidota bacterium]
KAAGPDLIPAEAWKALGEEGVDILYDLMVKIFDQERIPEEWRGSILIPIFKNKGDVQNCSNYRGIKLMSHTLKILERMIDRRLRCEVRIGKEQLGFVEGSGTTDGIFCLRQLMEKYREKQRDLHLAFIDLEKAYDRVPRQEIWRCLREKMVPEKYVRIIQEMYKNVYTKVRSSVGETGGFEVEVGLHQGSALSPFLFNIVMDVMTRDVREPVPWCILYADDIALCAETREDLEEKVERWRAALEERGMRISRSKTEYMCANIDGEVLGSIQLAGEELKRVNKFKYLGSIVEVDGNMEHEVKHRIQAGWNNWRAASGVLCDRKVPLKLKGKFHRTVVRPAMIYGTETASLRKTEEKKMDVAEMRMLRWMSGVTREDRIRNEYIRGSLKVVEASKKIQEGRLRWYGHLLRRDENHVGRYAMDMEVQGRRRRGRPRKRWRDCVREDLQWKDIDEAEALNRNRWRQLIRNGDPI